MKKQKSFMLGMFLNFLVIASLILVGSPANAQISPPGVGTPDNSPFTSGIQAPPIPLPLPAGFRWLCRLFTTKRVRLSCTRRSLQYRPYRMARL